MTVLQTIDGRLLKRRGPVIGLAGGQGLGGGRGRPLWVGPDGADVEDDDGTGTRTVSFAKLYETQPICAAVINKLCRQIATVPLLVYEPGSQPFEKKPVKDSSLKELLDRPLPRFGAVNLKQWIGMALLTHGNSLIGKYRARPRETPEWLVPLDWRFVSAYAEESMPVEAWETFLRGERRLVEIQDTCHFAWQAPAGFIGISPLNQLGVTIRLEDAAQRYQTAAFRNGARPSGLITTPAGVKIQTEDLNDLRASVKALHEGVDNQFRVALLTEGADWKPMSFSNQEAELLEQRRINREEMAMVYDIPPPLIGDLTHGTFSNVEELHKMLYKTVLPPWFTLIQETIKAQLIDDEPEWREQGLFVEFDLREQLRGEPQEMSTALSSEVGSGLRTPNEGRDVLGLPRDPAPEADKLYIPINNLRPIDEKPPEPALAPGGPPDPSARPPSTGGRPKQASGASS